MLFRSNAAKRWAVDNPVGNRVDNPSAPTIPRDDDGASVEESLWLTGSESPIDRKTLLDELNAERFGLPGKAAK